MSPAFAHERTVLLVLTSHSQLGDTGKDAGYEVSEAAHPWKVFTDSGWHVHLATVAGGPAPEHGFDATDEVQMAWKNNPDISRQMHAAPELEHVNAAIYDAVFFVGGHGTMWDFPGNPHIAGLTQGVWEHGGVVAAVCHGPAALLDVTLRDGRKLLDGRAVTGFSNAEEKSVHLQHVVPFLLADALEQAGGKYTKGSKWKPHVVTDGKLITGQNPASAKGVAEAVVAAFTG